MNKENMNKENVNKEYPMIDFMKLFFSICVVEIHSDFLGILGNDAGWYVMSLLLRLAVPYFFVITGFFLTQKLNSGQNKNMVIKRYVLHMIPPLCLWGGLNLILYSIQLLKDNSESIYVKILRMLRFTFIYPLGGTWFVAACIIAAIIMFWTSKNRRRKVIIVVFAVVGYIWALLCNNYFFLVEGQKVGDIVELFIHFFFSARNGFFVGLPFMLLGALLSKRELIESKLSNVVLAIVFICSEILYIMEVKYVSEKVFLDDRSLFIFMVPLIICIVEILLRYSIKDKKSFKWMRTLSTVIFYSHIFLITLLKFFISNVMLRTFIAICIAVVLWKIGKKWKNKWFNVLIGIS